MIAAGIGCRKGVSAAQVIAAVEAALAEYGIERGALSVIATARVKGEEAGIVVASGALNLPLVLVDVDVLAQMAQGTLSKSEASMRIAGTPSVSEAAALAAAGKGARLAGPRVIVGPATCAIAFGGNT